MPTPVLAGRMSKAIDIIDDIDHIADAATIALAMISGGIAAPALAIKLVVKLGKHRLTRILKKNLADLGRVKKRRAGVRITVKCMIKVAPYPSFGIYT